jgi:hypothetical protein
MVFLRLHSDIASLLLSISRHWLFTMKLTKGYVVLLAYIILTVLIVSICASEASNGRIDSEQHANMLGQDNPSLRGLRVVSAITEQELDHCVASLEAVATNRLIGQEEFIIFLEDFSGRSLAFERFDDLPLSLVLIFYTAACSAGRDCDIDDPRVSLKHVGASQGLLVVFCTSVKDVAVVQIDYKFQYMIRFEGGESTEQLIEGEDDGIYTKKKLEVATQLVLLDNFGCDLGSQRRMRESLTIEALKKHTEGGLQVPKNQVVLSGVSKPDRPSGGRRRLDNAMRIMQQIGLPQCDFRVQARILSIFDFGEFGEIGIVSILHFVRLASPHFLSLKSICQHVFPKSMTHAVHWCRQRLS